MADKTLPYPTDKSAHERFKAGVAAYTLRDFEKAITEFKAAAAIEPAAIIFYNLARTYRETGDFGQSIWFFKRTLGTLPPPPEWLVKRIEGQIAEVEADRAKAAEQAPPAADPVAVTKPIAVDLPAVDASAVLKPPPLVNEAPDSSRAVLAWSLILGGVGVGAVSGLAAWSAVDKDHQADTTRTSSERAALYDAADTRATVAAITGAVAGAAIIGGVVVLVTRQRSTERRADPIALTLTPHQASISASLSF